MGMESGAINVWIPNVGATFARERISVRPLQAKKAHWPMVVTDLPMVTEVNPLQVWKA